MDAAGACLHVQMREMQGPSIWSTCWVGQVSALGEGGDRWHSLYDLRRDRVCPCPPLRWWCLTPKTRSGWRDQGLVFHPPPPAAPQQGSTSQVSWGLWLLTNLPSPGYSRIPKHLWDSRRAGPHLASSPGIQQALNKCELNEYTRRRGAVRPS